DAKNVEMAMPIFDSLKPDGPYGFVHAGPVGAGHYAKMVHNGIEHGLMQAFAEGYELLEASEYVDNVPGVIKSWREGSVVKSWLLDLLDRALDGAPQVAKLKGHAEDTGEGRSGVGEGGAGALGDARLGVPVPLRVIAPSLFAGFESRQPDSRAMKAVAALRQQF